MISYISRATSLVRGSASERTRTLTGRLPKVISITSPGATAALALATLPLMRMRPASATSLATVRRLMRRDTFKYLSKRINGPPLIRKKLPAVRTGRTLPAATVLFQRPPALPRAGRGSEGVFQRLALLKDDAAGRSDGDGLLGAGVDALPLGPLPHFKGAKARDGDLFAVGERPAEGLEHSVHGLVGVLFGHVGVCRNLRGQISLGHKMVPPKNHSSVR